MENMSDFVFLCFFFEIGLSGELFSYVAVFWAVAWMRDYTGEIDGKLSLFFCVGVVVLNIELILAISHFRKLSLFVSWQSVS